MGDVFESTMPEDYYIKKVADIESKLHNVEMLLIKHLTRVKAVVANNEIDIESHLETIEKVEI